MSHYDYETIGITNDFMFGYVMSDPKRCKLFLEQILGVEIDHVEYLEKQKSIDVKVDARSVRLDIYMSDGKTIYNCEMQTTSSKELPKRSRYYQGQIDMNLIAKGENYHKLKKSYVIFICTFDPFEKKEYVYRFENICQMEDGEVIILGDDTYKIFINTKGERGNVTKEFVELMDYFNDAEIAKESTNPLIRSIDQAVNEARSNEKWRHDYMTWQMYGKERYDVGKLEGIREEKKATARRMYQNGFDISTISNAIDSPEEEIEKWIVEE